MFGFCWNASCGHWWSCWGVRLHCLVGQQNFLLTNKNIFRSEISDTGHAKQAVAIVLQLIVHWCFHQNTRTNQTCPFRPCPRTRGRLDRRSWETKTESVASDKCRHCPWEVSFTKENGQDVHKILLCILFSELKIASQGGGRPQREYHTH